MKNNILDIKGILVGQSEDNKGKTGVTVVMVPDGAVCGVDVRGAAPGTRETDLLDPVNAMEKVNAVVLSGGSAFGLEAANGVMEYLEQKGIGFDVGCTVVPIVPQAVLFDLAYGDAQCRPNKKMGYIACENANHEILKEGSVGAGCGATVGKLYDMECCTKSGIGSYAQTLQNGITVAALIAVNAFGDVLENGKIIAGTTNKEKTTFIDTEKTMLQMASTPAFHGKNTTIGVIATNVALTKAEAKKVAGMAHDGLARAIRPVHTQLDGDTLFCLSTGEIQCSRPIVDLIGTLAVRVAEQAVIQAVKKA